MSLPSLGLHANFLIGADAFADIRKWHRWEDLVRDLIFIVVSRPGHQYEVPPNTRVLRLDNVNLPPYGVYIGQDAWSG